MLSITTRNYLLCFTRSLMAALFVLSVPAHSAPANDASTYIEVVGNKAVEIIANKNLDKATKAKKIELLFRDNVDVTWVGRFVVGRFWRQATDDQKKRYLKEYEGFLTRQYATRFAEYSGGSFKVTGATEDSEGEFTVNMAINAAEQGGEPVFVDYRVRADRGSFKIFDIIIEGVSMITTQRSEFNSVISNKGMDYLISQLTDTSVTPANPQIKP